MRSMGISILAATLAVADQMKSGFDAVVRKAPAHPFARVTLKRFGVGWKDENKYHPHSGARQNERLLRQTARGDVEKQATYIPPVD